MGNPLVRGQGCFQVPRGRESQGGEMKPDAIAEAGAGGKGLVGPPAWHCWAADRVLAPLFKKQTKTASRAPRSLPVWKIVSDVLGRTGAGLAGKSGKGRTDLSLPC